MAEHIPTASSPPAPVPALASVGARVRQCRQLRGWTQVELAERAGLTQSTISMIEKGARGHEMSLETAWRLAWSLGTSVDWLAGMPVRRG
jgi:transcriptional regulator with XRE-family HTH domain